MKKILLYVALCTSMSCATVHKSELPQTSGQVTYVPSNTIGTVTVNSTGTGATKIKTSADAAASAFYVLFFRGIPGSAYELPMIADETKANHPVVQGVLRGGYSSFITDSKLVDSQQLNKKTDGVKGNADVYQFTINCDALRRYLEKNGVIRKFGI